MFRKLTKQGGGAKNWNFWMRSLVLAASASFFLPAFPADKYYLIAEEKSTTYGTVEEYGFLNPLKWGFASQTGAVSEQFDSTADYIVKNAHRRLTVMGESDKTFGGGRIVLGEGKDHGALLLYTVSPNVTTFGNNGLLLAHGCILCADSVSGKSYITDGSISAKGVSDKYTDISFNANNSTLKHRGSLSVSESSTLVVGGSNGFGGGVAQNCTLELSKQGSCVGVAGTLSVLSQCGTILDEPDKTLAIGTTEIPGTLDIGSNCRLKMISGTDILSVGTLSLANNTWIHIPYDALSKSFGSICVTKSLSVAGTVYVQIPSILDVGEALSGNGILSVPSDVEIDESHFVLEDANNPYVQLEWKVENGVKTLYLSYVATPVFQIVKTATLGVSESWDDTASPSAAQAGKHYFLDVSKIEELPASASICMPTKVDCTSGLAQTTDGHHEFYGESLTLGAHCSLYWDYEANTPREFKCKLLRMHDGTALDGRQKAAFKLYGGVLSIISGSVKFGASNGRSMIIASDIVGKGEIILTGNLAANSSPYARYSFLGDNSGYKGSITIRQRLIESSGVSRVNYDTAYNSLEIKTENALGGNLSELTPKALTLSRYAQLRVEGNATLAKASNRGIFIEDTGRISVNSGKSSPYTFRMETPLAINGTFWKEGLGTLELAGTMAFGEDGVAETPESGQNNFIVTGGVVRVCSTGAVDGASMEFRPGSSLELAVDFDNEELLGCGIRNVKTDTPFVLADGVEKLPVSFNVGDAEAPSTDFSIALMTVSSAAAESVKAMLPTVASPFRSYSMTLTETTDDEAGTVTYGYRFVYQGLKVIVR